MIKQRVLELTWEETEIWDERNKKEHPNDERGQKRTKFGNKSQSKVCEKAEEIILSSLAVYKSEIKNTNTSLSEGQ